ncbi:hypothetical protein KY289_031610 [Solanum tuberosum]|nr:hypothetical protein KY289_031610 [Solanum tuberosum]
MLVGLFKIRFSKENILGAGGYGMVYHGNLINGTLIFVPEKEFQVEVEAIGHVRHKNLHHNKMLVYEYVNNGNLEQWLHEAMRHHMYLTWKARMKVLLGTAKASLILVWPNCLVPVKAISQLESTFGYVAPKYANVGLLNEKNDIYSFGGSVVRIDHTGRDHVDYGRPAQEVRYPSYLILRSN